MTIWVPLSLIIIAGLIASNVWLLYRVVYPLRRLSSQTARLAGGDAAALQTACGGIEEIGMLRQSMAAMAQHVGRSHEECQVYRSALTNGQEAERARIARELHDDTVQSLIAIAQSIDLATTWIEKEPQRTLSTLKMARSHTVETVDNVRRMIANLRPPALEELGLVPALQMLAQDVTDLKVVIHVEGPERRLEEAQELTLFRSVQEAIRNAQKHSHARQITVNVCYQPTQVTLNIADNGVGFALPETLEMLAEQGHYGMVGMAERVHSLKGTFDLRSAPRQGVQLQILLPVSALNQPIETVKDPVCGAVIEPQTAYGSVVYQDERYYFCCPVCQGAFQRQPEMYLSA